MITCSGTRTMDLGRALLSSGAMVFFLSGCAQLPDDVKRVLDAGLDHAERASQYRNSVDWNTVRKEVYRAADTARTVEGLGPAFKKLFAAMGDGHARVLHNNQQIAYYYGEPGEHLKGFDVNVFNRIQGGQEFPFTSALLHERIGYVRIIGLGMGDNVAMAQAIQGPICELKAQGADRWIIDLRYNGGGNVMPMLEGLAALLGDGPVGRSKGATEAEDVAWSVSNGDFHLDAYTTGVPNECTFPSIQPVAVLTSMYTASSGEMVAVAFKGRERTRFLGEATAGLTTATDWVELAPGTVMMISVGTYADRNGRVYKEYVDVDEHFTFVPVEDLETDATILRALAWLENQ